MGPTEGGNHWLCTLLGYRGESAPTDNDGYLVAISLYRPGTDMLSPRIFWKALRPGG